MQFLTIKRNTYQDSLRLIRLSNALASTDGADRVSVMMGTQLNKDMLAKVGMLTDEISDITPNDLIITADVTTESAGQQLTDTVDTFLTQAARAASGRRIRTTRSLDGALKALPDANIGVISIPGEYAAAEAHKLLEHGINVFLFSDNVSVSDEVALKRQARDAGLIVMGPDCGTGTICGIPLGFANTVPSGNIGLAAASGTGSQEVMVQIARRGGGISHAIGLGGRDLSEAVGGIACEQALRALDADPATDVIVLVSKPPSPQVRSKIFGVVRELHTPVVTAIVGDRPPAGGDGRVVSAASLTEAAELAVELAGTAPARPPALGTGQTAIKGLFTGGTFASEAAHIVADGLDLTVSETHDRGVMLSESGHRVIDLGDDFYTAGRPHPMIEPAMRNEHVVEAIADPATAVVLVDVVLGYGSHPDPAGVLAPAVAPAIDAAARQNRHVAVIAAVCGTADDSQGYADQCRTLRDAGITVMPSNAAAARYAVNIAAGRSRPAADNAEQDPLARSLLAAPPRVINIGLEEFTAPLVDRKAHAVQYDWHPSAGGDKHLQDLLAALR